MFLKKIIVSLSVLIKSKIKCSFQLLLSTNISVSKLFD